MPFGLTNAPSTFQSVMNDILREYLREFVLVFFDDILIYSSSLEVHLEHLELVFKKLQQHTLKVKESKCSFGTSQVEYLGHIISAQGASVDPTKIESISHCSKPKSLKGLRGFLGLAGYYKKFVRHFGIITKPLTNMLKTGGFEWTAESTRAFEALKTALTTTPVLVLPNFSKEFMVECDASGVGIGAVLSQEGHPIAFLSKALAPRHQALSVYDKEMLAVVFAVQHWRPYLLGNHFKIFTDHRTIEYFLGQRITTPAQQKWLLKLIGYDYSIHYKAGKNNAAPDALSRKSELSALTGVSQPIYQFVQEIQESCLSDGPTKDIIQQLSQGVPVPNYSLHNAQLLYKSKVFVPSCENWRERVLKEFHEGLVGGHAGVSRTYKRVARSFAWHGMLKDIKRLVAECNICQQNHYETTKPPGLLQPNSIPEGAWSDISMDFVEGLPDSNGKSVILVVVDRLTKYGHFIPLSHPYTAAGVAKVLMEAVFKLHGLPEAIISDRDPVFLSTFWEAFFQMQGTKLHKSSAYHPQTDGQTENLNRTLEQYLRCTVGEKPHSWVEALPWAEWWYNTAHHSAIGMTPFQALYGYAPPVVAAYKPGSTAVVAVDSQLQTRDKLLALLKRNLQVAQARMKSFYDKNHTERNFEIGQWVYLKLQPYKQQTVERRTFHKLSPRYYGPFQILQKIGSVAYKLKLPSSSRIHPVFHVSLLKAKIGNSAAISAHLPPDVDPANPRWYPARILDRGIFKKGNGPVTKWLIQWLGASAEEATWEEAEDIQHRYPDFQA
jgi:transposase InsO family protein